MTDPVAYKRWTPDEYLAVAINALPAIEAGKSKLEVLKTGMRAALDRNRWRKEIELKRMLAPSLIKSFEKYVTIAQAMPAEARAPFIKAPQEQSDASTEQADKGGTDQGVTWTPRNADKGREYKGNIRWTDHERARIARMVRYWLDNKIDTRNIGRLMVEAQELVIAPDRRRAVHGIMQGNAKRVASGVTENEQRQRDGENSIYLIAHEKFHPEGEYGPKADERRRREQAEQQEREREERNAGFVPPTTATAAQALLRGEDHSSITFDIPAEDAPDPKPTESRIAEAARVFGETVMGALDVLLKAHAAALMAEVSAKMNSMSALTGAAIAAQIQQGLRGTVQDMLNEELGTPTLAQPVAEAPARKLKVDVVGFEHGAHEQTVAHAFNGNVDLRFIHPDKASTYAPHNNRHVILLTGRIPHSLGHKIKAAKVEPIMVNRTTGHVIHAIEELMRAEGIENHTHA